MDALAVTAEASYRNVVYDEPRFVPYFRAATPEVELGAMPIGSRPARRTSSGGVETLRAIPWVFAWTQTRLLLPTWLGTGEALRAAFDRGDREILRELYREWAFFRSTIDLIAMVLAKADSRIAAEYDRQLVPPDLLPIGENLRQRLDEAIAAVLEVTGRKELLADNGVLRRSINVRNPYVDPINLVQIELLRRLRRNGAGAIRRPDRTRRRNRTRRRERLKGNRDVERVHDHRQWNRRGDEEYGVGGSRGSRGSGGSRGWGVYGSRPATVSDKPIAAHAPNGERRTWNAERRTPNRTEPNRTNRTPNAERRTPNAETILKR